MDDQFAYKDFDLLIEPGPRGRYRARVLQSPAGESAPVQFKLPFSPLELENFVLRVGQPRRGTRGRGRPESAPLKDFGGKLYGAVFTGEIRDRLLSSLSQTGGQGVGLRLRLRLTDAPELAELPWEFLYDPRLNRFLVQSRRTPLVRYLDLPDPPAPLGVDGPLRLLVMISSPSDYSPLDVEQEWSLVTAALARQQEEGRVVVERLAANMSTLREQLRRERYHVFHFVGHGRYRPDWGDGVLVMEDRTGRSHEVTGEELGGLLKEYDPTRLAVLNACEGARGDASDPFAGMAQSLIQQGLPAVVAMQFEITDDAAIIFARELYTAIADGYPLEAALAEARGAIRDEGMPTEWGTPVLYSRAPDGRLFDVIGRNRTSEAERQVHEDAEPMSAAIPTPGTGPAQHPKPVSSAKGKDKGRQPKLPPRQQAEDGPRRSLTGHTGAVYGVAFSPDGRLLASCGVDDTVRLWDPASGEHRRALTGRTGTVCNLAFSPDGRLLATGQGATGGSYDTVWLWDLASGEHRRALTGHMGVVLSVAFSPDGRLLASGSKDKTVSLTDPASGEHRRHLTGHGAIYGVAFSPDGRQLASGGGDREVWLWDPASGEHRRTLIGHTDAVSGVAFSPDGGLLASCSNDKTVRLWDAASGKYLRTLTGHTERVTGVAFSPDGQLLASCSNDKTVRLWDAASGDHRRTLTGHAGAVHGVAFSPDGRLLASGSDNKTVRLWDLTKVDR